MGLTLALFDRSNVEKIIRPRPSFVDVRSTTNSYTWVNLTKQKKILSGSKPEVGNDPAAITNCAINYSNLCSA